MNTAYNYKPIMTLYLPGRSLQVTQEGGGFLFLTFGVGLGAINTGNNLLYLILAMCCSFIAVSGILSETSLKHLTVSAEAPKAFYAEDPSAIIFNITNHKRWIPSYSIHIELPVDPEERYQMSQSLYCFQIPPKQTLKRNLIITAYRRGPLRIGECQIKTTFPFGFFIKSKHAPLEIDSIVYPPIREVKLPSPTEFSDEGDGVLTPSGDDLFALREFQAGDSMSWVHWKSSAKTGALRVKEFAGGGFHSFTLFLNILNPATGDFVDSETMENRVTETASLAYHLIRRGDEVRLKTHDYESPFGNTENHLESLLRYLATVGLNPTTSPIKSHA